MDNGACATVSVETFKVTERRACSFFFLRVWRREVRVITIADVTPGISPGECKFYGYNRERKRMHVQN